MLLSELPIEIQEILRAERLTLCEKWYKNTGYEVCLVNKEGTRYFYAIRKQFEYTNDRGGYMPFGGGSDWHISYGKILWDRTKQVMGNDYDYFWTKTSNLFAKSANGTIIPKRVGTKKEVIELVKAIGIFNL